MAFVHYTYTLRLFASLDLGPFATWASRGQLWMMVTTDRHVAAGVFAFLSVREMAAVAAASRGARHVATSEEVRPHRQGTAPAQST